MDEVRITTKFMRGIIAKILSKVIQTKVGCKVDICLNEFSITFDDDKAHVHLNADAELGKDELSKIIKPLGL